MIHNVTGTQEDLVIYIRNLIYPEYVDMSTELPVMSKRNVALSLYVVLSYKNTTWYATNTTPTSVCSYPISVITNHRAWLYKTRHILQINSSLVNKYDLHKQNQQWKQCYTAIKFDWNSKPLECREESAKYNLILRCLRMFHRQMISIYFHSSC